MGSIKIGGIVFSPQQVNEAETIETVDGKVVVVKDGKKKTYTKKSD